MTSPIRPAGIYYHILLLADKKQGGIILNEDTTLKEFERSAKNCKHIMDRLNSAYYGVTFEELIRIAGKENPPPCDQHSEGQG